VDVSGTVTDVTFNNSTYYVYASVYEVSATNNQVLQGQSSQLIYTFVNTSPPNGGVPVGGGAGLPAPGFNPPPTLTNAFIIGPLTLPENAVADYLATAQFDDGTISTNTATTWTSSLFSISSAGRLTTGSVTSDTPATIQAAVTYGSSTRTGNLSTLILDNRPLSLQALGISNNQLRLRLSGVTGRRYAIEAATNLASSSNWLAIATNLIPTNSAALFNDTGFPTNRVRFYRARLTP
jgi:hypothetical protein